MSSHKTSHSYRPDIDGLRAVAVMLVVFYHAGFKFFSGGFIGVDVFFVLSGYLISSLLFQEFATTGKGNISFLNFYSKRVRRITPALFLLLATSVTTWVYFFTGNSLRTLNFVESLKYSVLGFANLFFISQVGGYFSPNAESMPLLHLWSLGIEEQFYFVWPFIFFILLRLCYLKESAEKTILDQTFLRRMIFLILLAITISFCFSEFLILKNSTKTAFYTTPARAWELLFGALIVFLERKFDFQKNSAKQVQFFLMIGLTCILGPAIFYTNQTVFPGLAALPLTFGTSLLIIYGGHSYQSHLGTILKSRLFTFIGKISYGIYLWHWLLFSLAHIYFKQQPPVHIRISLIFLTLVISSISFYSIEVWIRRNKTLDKLSPWFFIIIFFVIAFATIHYSPKIIAYEDKKMIGSQKITNRISARTSLYPDCFSKPEAIGSEKCTINSSSQNNISLWGDSHAFSYFPMLEHYSEFTQISVTLYSGDLSINGVKENFFRGSEEETLRILKNNELILNDIDKNIKKYKHLSVILASRWMTYSGKEKISVADKVAYIDKANTEKGSIQLLHDGVENTINMLKKMGVYRIVIVLPYPEFKFHISDCVIAPQDDCNTNLTTMLEYRKDIVSALSDVASKFENVRLLDPIPVVCSKNLCSQIENGLPMTFDDDHPSVDAASMIGLKNQDLLNWLAE